MRCAVVLGVFLAEWACWVAARVNYCGAKMCSHTNAHTFCQYPEGPGPDCKGYMDAQLSMEEKAQILARLNQRRSAAAAGRLRGLPTAGNMLKLRWVEELAREAQRWADQCRPPRVPEEHDSCRDLYSTSVGQCVASVVGEAPGLRPESMVDMWYMQSMYYKANVTSYELSILNRGFYGDFAQMIWAQAYMVGCGRSRFMIPWNGRVRSVERLVCNLAPRGPAPGRALWTPAAPTAACPARSAPDPALPALCTYPETVRRLQEELDRMENALSTTVTVGKVRRELPRDDTYSSNNEVKSDPEDTSVGDGKSEDVTESSKSEDPPHEELNSTEDKTPMMNMVMRYMPYLKEYQNNILKTSNQASALSPSIILALAFCL